MTYTMQQPPVKTGDDKKDLNALYDYVSSMNRMISMVLNCIDEANLSQDIRDKLTKG